MGLVLVAAGLAAYLGAAGAIRARIEWLANQPGVQTAFQAEGGSSDALVALIAFAVLTPIAAGLLILLLELGVKEFELVLSGVHLPEWVSMPLVLGAVASGTYAVREAWWPPSLHILGLVARAYLVFSSFVPSPPT